ncbi:CUE domain-containing protein 2 [Atheta coriaria]|uniref:CUE domain-containing protein 2 n=1 Tax=Dalotia coriaria TaxID=877792 RepID=UPI0031F4529E
MSSKNTLADQERIIKDSLFAFVRAHIPNGDLSLIDEIVLSYVVSILEDVSSDPVFDVEGFCEMMSAYFPEFESLNHATVCSWMFELEAKLRDEAAQNRDERDISLMELSMPEILPCIKPTKQADVEDAELPKRVHKISEVSDGGSDSSFGDFAEEIDSLQDMFPHVYALEIKHCLAIACGDPERATQILLHRQELGQSITNNASLILTTNKQIIDDDELKHRIIERYSYVDQESLAREHRPVAPKVEPKKLVRYRDNKIVSLKGERYTEVKKGDDVEDVSLKKSKKQQAHCP